MAVWVWVGSHTNCTGVVGCAWATSCRGEKQESTRSSVRQAVELISEMMILERRLVQVGSGAALGLPCLVWRGSGFEGFGLTLEQVGSVAVTTPYSFGRRVSGFAGFGVTLAQVGAVAVTTPE